VFFKSKNGGFSPVFADKLELQKWFKEQTRQARYLFMREKEFATL